MRSTLARRIKCDLEDIADWIALDNPARAVALVGKLRAEFKKIAQNPMIYQLRPEIGDDARLATVGRYVILFRIADGVVRFERVVYGGRDLSAMYPSNEDVQAAVNPTGI